MEMITGLAVVAVAVYCGPPMVRRYLMRRKHKVYHYIEYELFGDLYSTRDNGAINEFIADALLSRLEQLGGEVVYHYKRQSLELVQGVIDSRYAREQKLNKGKDTK